MLKEVLNMIVLAPWVLISVCIPAIISIHLSLAIVDLLLLGTT
jgi:hypothetical protein